MFKLFYDYLLLSNIPKMDLPSVFVKNDVKFDSKCSKCQCDGSDEQPLK